MEETRSADPRNGLPGAAQPPSNRLLALEDLLEVRTLAPMRSVALSPDGRYVAYATQRSGDICFRDPVSLHGVPVTWEACRLTVLDAESGTLATLVPDTFSAWTPAWSPDGARLAFLAAEDREGPVELWVWKPGDGPARRVTPRALQPHGVPRWFPDGRRMCVSLVPAREGIPQHAEQAGVALFESPAPEASSAARGPVVWGDLAAVDMETGEVRSLVESLPALEGFPSPEGGHILWVETGVRPDPAQFLIRHAVHLVRADGWRGQVGCLETGVNWHHWYPRWSPDGRRFCALVDGAVAVWEVDRPAVPSCRLALPEGVRPNGWLAWTADGSGIVAWGGQRLWVFPRVEVGATATEMRAHKRAISAVIQRMQSDALPPGDIVAITQGEIQHLPPDGAEGKIVAEGLGDTRGFGWRRFNALGDATPDGQRFVYSVGDPRRRSDLWLASDGGRQRRRLTDLNPHLDGILEGTWHRFAFWTAHGEEVGAVVLTPPGWQPGTPCPMVVSVYPGWAPSRNPGDMGQLVEPELLAARGYAVMLPDVPYDQRAVADPIEATPAAVLPAVNEAVRLGYADPRHLAVVGSSYGGTAVLGLLTRTGRFRAAVAAAGAGDMAAAYGRMHLALEHPEWVGAVAWCETGQGGMGGAPWERPLRYVANSPVYFLDRVTTPLLLVTGSQDTAVSWAQAGEVFVGLRRLGRTCTLLVGRGEGHGCSRWSEANRREAVGRILDWLERHLGAA